MNIRKKKGDIPVEGVDAVPYNNFTEYANRFYTNEQAQTWYRDHIDTVLNRVNTVNGRKYTIKCALIQP